MSDEEEEDEILGTAQGIEHAYETTTPASPKMEEEIGYGAAMSRAAWAGAFTGLALMLPVLRNLVSNDAALPYVQVAASPIIGLVGGIGGGLACVLSNKKESAVMFGAVGGASTIMPFVLKYNGVI
jgi:hypothetical protein